ncbi:MAG: Tetraacyldisaccharide 4'-kinase [Ignavibacteriaceae bacterium]|nr:Tetraacyldisaccharide 4'-kinase [Ignavibacteriaceae bacterium]
MKNLAAAFRFLLWPLVPVYLAVTALRNMFFSAGINRAVKSSVPVISVGNINTGGSGKTPFVIYMSKLLLSLGKKPSVLSRGYGRTTKGYLLAAKEGRLLTSVEKCGDEIYQTVLESGVSAAVSESRVEGAKKLAADTGTDVIVLDDGFQHRWLSRDIDLVIFDVSAWLSHPAQRTLLPAGNLRELPSAIRRADAVVLNHKFSEKMFFPEEIKKYTAGKKVFNARYSAASFRDVKSGTEYDRNDFNGQKSLVVCGIANPHSFIMALASMGINTAEQMVFRDHKFYTNDEVQLIRKKFYSTNAQSVITTQKDAVKLRQFARELDDIDIYALNIELVMEEAEEFKVFVKSKI